MIDITKMTGRLGNQMFQFAFAYTYARRLGIDRYFQDPKWFLEYSGEIRYLFQEGIPERKEAIAIHVRRGDYVNHDFYVDLMKTDYYQNAMGHFPNSKFIVFSDDIEWCKKQEIFKDCEFIHGTEISDMNDMASCSGQIIANSSFSWWGAWITPYSTRVIAPNAKNWHTDGKERTVCPDHWIRI